MVEVGGEVVAVPPFVAHGHVVAASLLATAPGGPGVTSGDDSTPPAVPEPEPTVLRLSARPDASVRAVHDGHWLLLQARRDGHDEY